MNNQNQISYTPTDYLRGAGILVRLFAKGLWADAPRFAKNSALLVAGIFVAGQSLQSCQDWIDGDKKIRLDTNTVLYQNGVIESSRSNGITYFNTQTQIETLRVKTGNRTETSTRAFNQLAVPEVELYKEWMKIACDKAKEKQTPAATNFDGFINRHCQ